MNHNDRKGFTQATIQILSALASVCEFHYNVESTFYSTTVSIVGTVLSVLPYESSLHIHTVIIATCLSRIDRLHSTVNNLIILHGFLSMFITFQELVNLIWRRQLPQRPTIQLSSQCPQVTSFQSGLESQKNLSRTCLRWPASINQASSLLMRLTV